MDISRLTTPQRVSAVAILAVVLGAFLPWVSIFGVTVFGIEGDGIITLAFAIAGGITLVLTTGLVGEPKEPGKKSHIALLVLAVLTMLISMFAMSGAAAFGLYLTLFAGIAWVVGAAWQLNLSKPGELAEPDGPATLN
jgi:hypothetical protein